MAPRPAFAPRLELKTVVIGLCVALVAWLALVPLVFLLWQSFLTPQTASVASRYTLENYWAAYFRSETAELFLNSVEFALGSALLALIDRKSTRLNSSHEWISYAVFCLKKN